MSLKRKHRIVVDITMEEPTTEKRAKNIVDAMLEIGHYHSDRARHEVTNYEIKQFSKVLSFIKRTELTRGSEQ